MLWYGSETPELVRFRNTRTLAGHAKQNAHAKRLFHVTFGTHKKQCFGPVPKHPNTSRSGQCLTSPDRQLRKHEKTMQKPCSGWSCGWSCNGSFGGSSGLRSARSRNSQTPAGFKPNLSKNQPPKNCLTSPSDAHKKDEEGQRQCLTSPDRQLRKHEKTMQKPCSGWSCGWSCNGTFGGSSGLRSARSRNSQTPAGFKPNLSKNQPPKKCQKTLSRHLWNP